MPTIGGNQVGAFSAPVDGTTNSASDVLTNDNALRTGFNAHDADATIHIQSSTLASRPAAGTAGRIWVTSDARRAYYDDGTSWIELQYLSLAGGGTVAGATTVSGTLDVTGTLTRSGAAAAGVFLRGNGTSFVASTLTVPDTAADKSLIYASSANVLAALPIGTNGQVLTITSGAPAWGDASTAKFVVDGWQTSNIAANQTALQPERFGSSVHAFAFSAGRAGSITGLTARLAGTISAGTITVIARHNATTDTISVSFTSADGLNPTKTATAAAGTHAFAANDNVEIKVTSDASLSPATIDLVFAGIELTYS